MALSSGCGSDAPQAPLSPSAFAGRTAQTPTAKTAQPKVQRPATAATAPSTQPAASQIQPPENPAAIPLMLAPGQYQTIGGVVAEVNGHPIYANKVLRLLRSALMAKARELNPEQFRQFAAKEINDRIKGLERDELLFGAADRYLENEDRRLAEYLTMQHRTRKITEAGGSIELARRRAAEQGDSFEEMIYDYYRQTMTNIYNHRKIIPRIQISADDMRAYYNANLANQFTEFDEVTFRLIKVDTRSRGTDKAKARAEEIYAKANSAEFAELARTMNDDPRLARSGGQEVPIQRGAYRLEKVETALWQTPAGQVSPIIEDAGGFYIAKVESRKQGKILPFEDPDVQNEIHGELRRMQFMAMAQQIEAKLRENSMARRNEDMIVTAVEMAMQGYAIWSKQ